MDVSKLVLSPTPAKTRSEQSPRHRTPTLTAPNDEPQDRLGDSYKIGERLGLLRYDKFDDLRDEDKEVNEGHVDVGRSCSGSRSIGNRERLKHGCGEVGRMKPSKKRHASDSNTFTNAKFILSKSLRRNPTRAAKQHPHACINTIRRSSSPSMIDKPRPSFTNALSNFDRSKASIRTPGLTHSTPSPYPELLLDYGTLWRRFHSLGNEMIITKSGRCLFPILKVTAQNLDPQGTYSIILDFVQLSPYRYRWRRGRWVCIGEDQRRYGVHEHQPGGAVKPARLDGTEECRDGTIDILRSDTYTHPDSPQSGSFWMNMGASFNKGKLTNRQLPPQPSKTPNGSPSKSRPQPNHSSLPPGYFVLNSFHRYQPRVHLVQHHLDGEDVVTTFRFAETAFVAVTHYQNERVNKLKKENNPHAKGFKYMERWMEIENQNTKAGTDDEMEERAEEINQMEAEEYTDSENDNSADNEEVEASRKFVLMNHSALPKFKRTSSWFELQREREAAYDAATSSQQNAPGSLFSTFEKREAQYITPQNATPPAPCTPPASYCVTSTPFTTPIDYDSKPTNIYKSARYPINHDADFTIPDKPTHHPTSHNHSTSPFHFSVKNKVDHAAYGTSHNVPLQTSYTTPASQANPSTLPIPPSNNPYFPPILPSPTLSQDSFPWYSTSPNMTSPISLPRRTSGLLDLPPSTLASHYPLRPRLKHNHSEPAPPAMSGFSFTSYEAPMSDCRNSNTLPGHNYSAPADREPRVWTQQYQIRLPENQLATAVKKAHSLDGKPLSFPPSTLCTAWAPEAAPYTPTGGLAPAFQALSVDVTAESTGRLEAENARLREFIRGKFGHEVERQMVWRNRE